LSPSGNSKKENNNLFHKKELDSKLINSKQLILLLKGSGNNPEIKSN
jgi:hypothetical protein